MQGRWRIGVRLAGLLAMAVLTCIAWNTQDAGHAPKPPQAGGSAFQSTPARLRRGEYLAENVVTCFRCHSERDWNATGAPPSPDKKGAGSFFYVGAGPLDPHKPPVAFAANITPDPETGVERWSNEQLARAIRESILPDGRTFPSKFHAGPRKLSDEDLASIVVYLRSIPSVRKAAPKSEVSATQAAPAAKESRPLSVAEPVLSDPVKRGEYLASIADCASCHTADAADAPLAGKKFGGGKMMSDDPEHYVVTPNITMDPSGINYYDEAAFAGAIQRGLVGARKLYPIMPWGYFRNLSDEDVKAIYAFLKTQPRVQHIVDNSEPPTFCRLCLQRHGSGDRN